MTSDASLCGSGGAHKYRTSVRLSQEEKLGLSAAKGLNANRQRADVHYKAYASSAELERGDSIIVGSVARRVLAIGMVLLVAIAGPLAFADGAQAATRTVRVGMYENIPKVYTDDHGEPAGIFPDLLKEIAAAEGWRLVWVRGTWDEGQSRLGRGEIDLMPDMAWTEDRELRFDFHQTPVAESWSYIYTRRAVRIEGLSDLDGKRVAVLQGSIQEAELRRLTDGFGYSVRYVPVRSLTNAFDAVAAGEVDAAAANHFFGQYYARDHGLKQTAVAFSPTTLHFATQKGHNADLLAAIDDNLAQWFDEPGSVYYQTIERYTESATTRIPQWLRYVLWGGGTLIVLAVAMLALLRWQVTVRTRDLAEARDAATRAEETLSFALSAAQEGIWDWDIPSGEVVWSDRCYAMFGYELNEIDLNLEDFMKLVHPDDLDHVIHAQHEALVERKTRFEVEYSVRTKSGEYIWISSIGKPVEFDSEGNTIRAVGINTDITERRLAQLELERYRDHLEELVSDRTAALEAANAELEEATKAKSRFLANMSHELRTPLNSIIGFSGILASGKAGQLTPEQQFQIELVHKAGQHLLDLINGVLDLAKVESGRIEAEVTQFDLIELLRGIADAVRPLAESKGLDLTTDLVLDTLSISSDKTKIRQIVFNLLGNAVKFTDQGTVTLRLEPPRSGKVLIAVSDSGSGIPADELKAVFEPFNQASIVDGEKVEGTGLGLPISREYANLVGGRLSVESELGRGSTFTLELPLR